MSGGLGHAYRVPVRGAIDDRREVDCQLFRRQTSSHLKTPQQYAEAYWTGVLNFESIDSKSVRAKSALESRFFPNVGDSFCVVGKSGGTDRAGE